MKQYDGDSHEDREPPPILGTWTRLYAAVALILVAYIALFALFTWTWNR